MTEPQGVPLPPRLFFPNFPRPSGSAEAVFHNRAWHLLTDTQLGINVIDPDGHEIGLARAVRTFAGFDTGSWKPVDGFKHVLVGQLDRYSWYNPWTSGDEADFNLNVYPAPPFRRLLDWVVQHMDADERSELHGRRRGPGYVIECEITPDEEYYDNFWFPTKEGWQSPLEGATIGVYGPWVQDFSHKGRPEIHPCEVIWFRTGNITGLADRGFVRWNLILLQDDSNRFDRVSDYRQTPPAVVVHRPWSASPRRARFTVALLAIRGQHINYNIKLNDGRRMVDWPGEETRSLTVTAEDETTLTVTKRLTQRSSVKIRLGRMVADPDDQNLLHCFLRMDLQVGQGDRGKEGFAELVIEGWAPRHEIGTGDNLPGDPRGPNTNNPNAPREP
ncbi:hypothetical protein [Streptosporangium roseum]|uniref:hypothetical protein n=1 Tax=Streptosporangium roseum TaxID=2001 RepID=UPI0033223CBC